MTIVLVAVIGVYRLAKPRLTPEAYDRAGRFLVGAAAMNLVVAVIEAVTLSMGGR
jgi:hypothetical protein